MTNICVAVDSLYRAIETSLLTFKRVLKILFHKCGHWDSAAQIRAVISPSDHVSQWSGSISFFWRKRQNSLKLCIRIYPFELLINLNFKLIKIIVLTSHYTSYVLLSTVHIQFTIFYSSLLDLYIEKGKGHSSGTPHILSWKTVCTMFVIFSCKYIIQCTWQFSSI